MFVQQLNEHIAKGSIYCICKNQSQIEFSSLLRISVAKFFSCPTMVAIKQTLDSKEYLNRFFANSA